MTAFLKDLLERRNFIHIQKKSTLEFWSFHALLIHPKYCWGSSGINEIE